MNERTWERTASSKGSNQSLPANGDGGDGQAGVASVMAWVPSRSCRSEPTPPQPISTNPATRPRRFIGQITCYEDRSYPCVTDRRLQTRCRRFAAAINQRTKEEGV